MLIEKWMLKIVCINEMNEMTLKPHHILEEKWADGRISEIMKWEKGENKLIYEKGMYIEGYYEWVIKKADGVE